MCVPLPRSGLIVQGSSTHAQRAVHTMQRCMLVGSSILLGTFPTSHEDKGYFKVRVTIRVGWCLRA
jgi:hypothetical protein